MCHTPPDPVVSAYRNKKKFSILFCVLTEARISQIQLFPLPYFLPIYTHSSSQRFFSNFESSLRILGNMVKMLSKLYPKVTTVSCRGPGTVVLKGHLEDQCSDSCPDPLLYPPSPCCPGFCVGSPSQDLARQRFLLEGPQLLSTPVLKP